MPHFEKALEGVLSYRAAASRYVVAPAESGTVPYLPYDVEVEALFAAVAEFLRLWAPTAGDYLETSRHLRDRPGAVAAAGPEAVKAVLTFVWRGERYRDGFWGTQLQSGLMAALLDRLHELDQAGQIKRIEASGGGK